jgi:purine-binding chemotaxis protein CheW
MLLAQVGTIVCAFPLMHVVETMRPLPIEPVRGGAGSGGGATIAACVAGLAIVRGEPIPVVYAAQLLGGAAGGGTRFVILRSGERRIALVVDAVLAVRAIEPATLAALPPLLGDARREVATAIGALDAALLVVLDAARIVPDETWRALDAAREAAP